MNYIRQSVNEVTSGVAKGGGGGGAVRPWRHFYGGGTIGYAVGY